MEGKKLKTKNKYTLFVIPALIIMVLLVIQAFCDLELPEYTSNIINNGIARNGISSGVPEVIPEDIYNALVKISENNISILASYDLVVKDNLSTRDLEKISKTYPLIKEENLYLLRDLDQKQITKLESELEKPLIITDMFASNSEILKNSLNRVVVF